MLLPALDQVGRLMVMVAAGGSQPGHLEQGQATNEDNVGKKLGEEVEE